MIDEQREIIETIRDRRDRAVDAHGRTAAAMDVMHLSPFEQAVYVDESLNTIDRLTAERDVAYAELSRVRYAIDRLTAERDAARAEVERLRAVLGGVPEVLESYAESVQPHLDSSPNPAAGLALSIIRAKAAVIRAALKSEVSK